MVGQFHVNKKGEIRPCPAKKKCRLQWFDGETAPHFESIDEARAGVEKIFAQKYGSTKSTRSNPSFLKLRQNIRQELVNSGVIPTASSLPDVHSTSELIEKWFAGDKNKYNVIKRIVTDNTMKKETKASVGSFVASGLDVSISQKASQFSAPSPLGSEVEILDEDSVGVSLESLHSGKMKLF